MAAPRPARRALLACLLCAAAVLACPLPAAADVFGPISLVSQDSLEQAEYAHDAAISEDGRYVAFDGSLGGVTGVWRRDLRTGEVRQVAGGDAELPSISEDGQYVSFTTNEGGQLASDTNGQAHTSHPEALNVYVRDMAVEPSEANAFIVASAVNGSEDTPLSYRTAGPAVYGSVAAGRSALSANGQEVAFVTTAESNLAGEGTPPLQVAVRNLATRETLLVSTERKSGGSVAPDVLSETEQFGAVYTLGRPPEFEATPSFALAANQIGASISADGSTVTWLGQDVGAQAQVLPNESLPPNYAEPLWRRITDLPANPIRRVTGGSDPTNPACIASGETELPERQLPSDPCQGPFPSNDPGGMWGGGIGDTVPQLSANGETVAFLSTATPLALGADFGKAGNESRNSDIYVVDMHETRAGHVLSRTEALTPLTELASGNEADIATNGPVVDLAVSPDGSHVAFTTQRTTFPLNSLNDVSVPDSEAGLSELFDVDLEDDTLTRVTGGFEGGPSEHPHEPTLPGSDPYQRSDGALSPSFSANGDTLAFSSTASNLVYGDGNTPGRPSAQTRGLDGGDVFVVSRVLFGSTPAPQVISSPPAEPQSTPGWTLGVTSVSRRDGSVLLYVTLPGAGTVQASADSAVRVALARSSHAARKSRAHSHASAVPLVATRTVASARQTSSGGVVALTLRLAPSYRALAGQRGGLSASVSVVFTAAGHPTLRKSIPVTFIAPPAPAHASKHPASKARKKR